MEILYMLAAGVILVIVGIIGNKIVDGAGNAMRSSRKKNGGETQYTKSESLASRYKPGNKRE